MNNVTLIGNLATDPELRDFGDGKKRTTFMLAIDRTGQDGGADFVWITTWDRQAEVCEQYLAKGRRVGVEGRLRSRSWEDADGKRRSAVEVVASQVDFLSTRDEAHEEGTPFEPAAA